MLTKVLLPDAEHVPLGEEADAKLLIGDAALQAAPSRTRRRTTTSAGSGSSAPACRWCSPSGRAPEPAPHGPDRARGRARRAPFERARAEPEKLAHEAQRRVRLPGRLPRALLREAPLPLRPARARRAATRSSSWRATSASWRGARSCASSQRRGRRRDGDRAPSARRVARSSTRRSTASGSPTTTRSRCSSRATSSRSAARRTSCAAAAPTPTAITFIVDRNLNYTNVCVTDCDFCAFYRSPGDRGEGYLLPKPVIFKKIEETLAIGGTGVPDAGRPPPRSRHRLLRGPLPLDQGALPDPPARALAARGPAHRAPLEAVDPGDAHAAARRRPRLDARRRRRDPRRPRPRDHRAEEDEVHDVARTSCATRSGSACRRPRR